MLTSRHLRTAGILTLCLASCALLFFLAAMFKRPAWGALSMAFAIVAVARALRGSMPRSAWVFIALAASPLTATILVSITNTAWSSIAIGVIVAVGLLFSAALLWLARVPRATVTLFLALQLLLVAPIDVAMSSVSNGPRVLPLEMGLLTAEGLAAAERGEFVSGGCMVSGIEPQWVLAW